MLSTNDIAGFLNHLYLKKNLMNQLDFWHDDIDSRHVKEVCKFLFGLGQKS